ncbi:IclR family transcriptional regulator [Actinomadura sp. NBRC 104412]|uniref:IclR family transcriptional regulator n=1 Tax=Actinomadura sp. NBRC 104412 TaxID=3032203 RepID=UPI0024A1B03C|nr:IclR family transcriptional regulator [Actinomadura sp. NBRC 104412]GLZ05608.1 IclR family transcriptional regulator [Actinomadura sp. NBRC 104412]
MQNVVNTLRILEEVAVRQPAGVGELSRVLDLPKSTVQRALRTLATAGWIRPAGGEVTRWVLTAKALHVGRHATGELSLRDAAVPVMEDLRRRTEETIHLAVPEGDSAVLIERLETPKVLRIILPLGKALPVHASANGKAILAHSPPEVIERHLTGGLVQHTATTITDPGRMRAELALIRERGYSTNSGEWRDDIAAVAAPVLGRDGRPVAAISVSVPSMRMTADLYPEYGRLVIAAAATLAERLSTR